jgi:type I site-specific restriction endonuclease
MATVKIFTALWLCVVLLSACQSAYYHALEEFGYHKRDLLVSRVEDAQDSQQAAKKQFKSALQAFKTTVDFEGGELEERYDTLNAEYERSEMRAQEVSDRINAVEDVAEALFDEWNAELDEYTNPELRSDSVGELEATEHRYELLMQAMRRAEDSMAPVLAAFHDQVLALKHNLNARAINALADERTAVEADVASLMDDMEIAIKEAQTFLAAVDNNADSGR